MNASICASWCNRRRVKVYLELLHPRDAVFWIEAMNMLGARFGSKLKCQSEQKCGASQLVTLLTTQGKFAQAAMAAGPVSPVVSTSTSFRRLLVSFNCVYALQDASVQIYTSGANGCLYPLLSVYACPKSN